MIRSGAEVDNKHKAILRGAGHVVYMACDELAQELLKQMEKAGKLNMDGAESDATRSKLIESIIDTIAKDTPNESVMREVDFLSAIQSCIRNEGESVPKFVNRFKGTVARYVNQTAELNAFANRQFAILILRNAKLSPGTMNSVTFQLTTNASSSSAGIMTVDLTLEEGDAKMILSMLKEDVTTASSENSLRGKDLIKRMESLVFDSSGSGGCMFTLEESAQSLSQVESEALHDEVTKSKASMLGKRHQESQAPQGRWDRIRKMKAESKCKACGEAGHWFRDRKECIDKMKSNDLARRVDDTEIEGPS